MSHPNSIDVSAVEEGVVSSGKLAFIRVKQWLQSPSPYLNVLGICGFVAVWYLTTEVLNLPLFNKLPGPRATFTGG